MIPNVRAGFFKAKFGKWSIVSFRPERDPMKHFAEALASALGIESIAPVLSSLRLGYSALVELYKNSTRYDDINKGDQLNKENANLLIIVDQFEEFFTNPENYDRATSTATESTIVLINLLLETAKLASEKDLPIYIVCTMRSDFLGQSAALPGFPEKLEDSLFYLPRLSRKDYINVIEEPAMLSGNSISERLIQRLLNEIHGGSDILPVLQHCLSRMWYVADSANEEMDLIHYAMVGGMLQEQLPKDDQIAFEKWHKQQPEYKRAYPKKHGLHNVLNIHADELYEMAINPVDAADDENQVTIDRRKHIIEITFKCLTKIDDNRAVRQVMTLKQVREMLGEEEYSIDEIRLALTNFRNQGNTLIRPFINHNDSTAGLDIGSVMDISHEALIRNWKKLTNWAWEEYESLQMYLEFRAQMDKWVNSNKSNEFLMSVGSLQYFETWFRIQQSNPIAWLRRYFETDKINKDGEEIEEREVEEHFSNIKEFIEVSRNEIDKSRKEIAKKRRLIRTALIAISILLVITGFAFVFSNIQKNKAVSLKNKIERTAFANNIATKAYIFLQKDPTLAFRLAEQAYNIEPTPLAKKVIMDSYQKVPYYNKLSGHGDAVVYAKFSPNGKYVITGSKDNTFRLWSSSGKELHILKGHESSMNPGNSGQINFSPDSRFVLTAATDNTARIWDLEGNCIAVLEHEGAVNSAYFANILPDDIRNKEEYLIMTGSNDKKVRLWNIKGRLLREFTAHNAGIKLAKFSQDGKFIITASSDNTCKIWNLNGKQISLFKGHNAPILDAVISNDLKYIVTCSFDNTVRVWDFYGKELKKLSDHEAPVSSVKISDNNEYIISSSFDHTAKIWNLDGDLVNSLTNHLDILWSVEFSPDNKYILTSSHDGTARLWNMEGEQILILKGHKSLLSSASFSPDGEYVVTSSSDKTAHIWKIAPEEKIVLKGHTNNVMDANFSTDGKYIITAGWDNTARLWDHHGKLLKIFGDHKSYRVNVARFCFENEYVLTGTYSGGTVYMWDLDGREISQLKGHKGPIWNIDVNPINKFILTESSKEDVAYLWNSNGKKIQTFENISKLKFSSDGKYILGVRNNATVKILELADANVLNKSSEEINDTLLIYQTRFDLTGHSNNVTSVNISENNKFIITTSKDSTAKLWSLNLGNKKAGQENGVIKVNPELSFEHSSIVNLAKIAPDNQSFLSISQDNVVRIWDMNGELLADKRHLGIIYDANYSHDSKYIVTGCEDFSTCVFDLKGNRIQNFTHHTSLVYKVKFSPNDKYLLTASFDNTARLLPWKVSDVLSKINIEKVRGQVWELSEEDKKVFNIID